MFSQIIDYADRAVSRMLTQYRERPRMRALVSQLATEVQAAEDALWAMVAQTAIDTADGVWLDRLGAIVGEGRDGASDADYRDFIRARITANKSESTVEDILDLLRAWNGGTLPSITFVDAFPAAFELTLSTVVSLADLPRLFRLLRSTRAAGIGAMFIYQTVADADAFTFSSDATLQASSTQGFGDATDPDVGGAFVGAEQV